jgi:gas vesicle protein
MTESTFTAGERATLDLRDSTGNVTLQDHDAGDATIRIAAETETPPFVLREGDTFRIRLPGGTVSVPPGLPVEAMVPPTVQLRLLRTAQSGGETVIKPVTAEAAGTTASKKSDDDDDDIADLDEFVRRMSEHGQRILHEMTRAMRSGGYPFSNDLAQKLEEAGTRIEEHMRRAAGRVQREAERVQEHARRAEEHARRAAERVEHHQRHHTDRTEERSRRHAERGEEIGRRVAERVARAGRGRWWFADRFDDWGRSSNAPSSRGSSSPVTAEERIAILQMLKDGKISAEQAEKLLDALGS